MSPAPGEGAWAVIFISRRRAEPADGYDAMARRMMALAQEMPGFLGADSVRDADGEGITVSYWRSREDIAAWRAHPEHVEAQQLGRERFYEHYRLHVARIDRSGYWPGAGSGGME